MLVYIDELGEWFNSAETPIMLHLSGANKKQIANMPRDHERYLSCPSGTSRVRMNSLLQIPPPMDAAEGLSDLNIEGLASSDDTDGE